MSLNLETVLVVLIVLGAFLYLCRVFQNTFRQTDSESSGDCDGCKIPSGQAKATKVVSSSTLDRLMKRGRKRLSPKVMLFVFVLLLGRESVAEEGQVNIHESEDRVPKPCIGYDPLSDTWGARGSGAEGASISDCPDGSGFIGTTVMRGESRKGGEAPVVGFCCPLPKGALNGMYSHFPERCPENSVATGIKMVQTMKPDGSFVLQHLLRCSVLDVTHVQIGEEEEGTLGTISREIFGFALKKFLPAFFAGRPFKEFLWGEIPAKIRYAFGRITFRHWNSEFCVGRPPGSFLVARSGSACEEQRYRVVRIRNQIQDLPCLAVDNVFSKKAKCLTRSED